jgi:hypothetical protein
VKKIIRSKQLFAVVERTSAKLPGKGNNNIKSRQKNKQPISLKGNGLPVLAIKGKLIKKTQTFVISSLAIDFSSPKNLVKLLKEKQGRTLSVGSS